MQTSEVLIELRKGLRVFKAFEHAEELAVAVEGLEQNQRELQAAIAKLRDEQAAALTEHAATVTRLGAERQAAEDAAARAKKAAQDAGRAEVAAARRRANEVEAEAARDNAAAAARRDEMLQQAAAAEQRVADAAVTLGELTAKIEAAKAQIAKLLG